MSGKLGPTLDAGYVKMNKVSGVPGLVRRQQVRKLLAMKNKDFKEISVIIWLPDRFCDLDLGHKMLGLGKSVSS